MEKNDRNSAMLAFLGHGMRISESRLSAATLGERSKYLGVSDLAKYAQCPRAALANKLFQAPLTFETQLTFARGHWFEKGIGESLGCCGLPVMSQLEIYDSAGSVPIKAHLDFVLVASKPEPTVRIVEVKSLSSIPDAPYPQHVFQAQAQVSLLHQYWNAPVFTLRRDDGEVLFQNVSFPQLCKSHFGVEMPQEPSKASIEAWLLCVTMKNALAFGPYSYSQENMEEVFVLAKEFWTILAQIRQTPELMQQVPYLRGFDPLCSKCHHNADCPKFTCGSKQPQWEAALEKLEDLRARRAAFDADIKELDAAIRQAYLLSGTKDWVEAGKYRFRVTQMPGRKSFNKGALMEELTGIFAEKDIVMDVSALIDNCNRQGTPYSTLRIMPNVA